LKLPQRLSSALSNASCA